MVKSWETKDWRSGARALTHGDLIRPELFSRSVNELAKGANTEVVHSCESDGVFFPVKAKPDCKIAKESQDTECLRDQIVGKNQC